MRDVNTRKNIICTAGEKYSKIENSKKHKAEGRNTDKTKTDIMPILIVGVGALIVVLGVICFILFTNGKKDKERYEAGGTSPGTTD